MSLELPFGIKPLNPVPVDAYYYNTSGAAYTNTAEVTTQVLSTVRYEGMTFNVAGVEYWFSGGIGDGDLKIKGGGSSYTFGNGLTESGGAVSLGGTATAEITLDSDYDIKFTRFSDSGNDYARVNIKEDMVDLSYFNSNTTGTETYESLFRFGTDIVNRWSRSPGIGMLTHLGRGYDTDSSLDGFHVYGTTGGYYADASDIIFRIQANKTVTLNLGSDARGDTYTRNSSGNFSRIAKGAAGTFFRAGASDPAWSTMTIPNTITAKSLLVANSANTLSELTLTAGQSVRLNAGGTAFEGYTPGGGGSSVFSDLTAATGTNTINNAGHAQEWQWNTLGGATGLKLSSTSTAAASNLQTVLEVSQSGANATSSQTTYGAWFSNTKTGTGSTNIGARFSASGGALNYGIYVDDGINLGFNPTIIFQGNSNKSIKIVSNIMTLSTFSHIKFVTYDGSGYIERARVDASGGFMVGGTTITPSAILDLQSTTKALIPPRMTTTQRDAIGSPSAGMVVFNTTTGVLNFHNGSAWGAV